MFDVVFNTGMLSMSKIMILHCNLLSTIGISSNDIGLFHSNSQWEHNSIANVVLIFRPIFICFICGCLAWINITKAYQKQLLSSLATLFTDVLLRMLWRSAEFRPSTWGYVTWIGYAPAAVSDARGRRQEEKTVFTCLSGLTKVILG